MRKRHKNVREMHIKLQLHEGDKNNLLEPPNRESLSHIHLAKQKQVFPFMAMKVIVENLKERVQQASVA